MKGCRQKDLFRQMVGVKRTELAQLLNHFWSDSLRLPVLRSAMYHAMPHRSQRTEFHSFLNPIHQQVSLRSNGSALPRAARSSRPGSNLLP
jgi:hypothetical protein